MFESPKNRPLYATGLNKSKGSSTPSLTASTPSLTASTTYANSESPFSSPISSKRARALILEDDSNESY